MSWQFAVSPLKVNTRRTNPRTETLQLQRHVRRAVRPDIHRVYQPICIVVLRCHVVHARFGSRGFIAEGTGLRRSSGPCEQATGPNARKPEWPRPSSRPAIRLVTPHTSRRAFPSFSQAAVGRYNVGSIVAWLLAPRPIRVCGRNASNNAPSAFLHRSAWTCGRGYNPADSHFDTFLVRSGASVFESTHHRPRRRQARCVPDRRRRPPRQLGRAW